jgi:hypothetical protein
MGYPINPKTEVGSDYSAQEVNVKRKTVFLVYYPLGESFNCSLVTERNEFALCF